MERDVLGSERQLTFASHGHILTNRAVWSPCGKWLVYDVRSDSAGNVFDGTRIEQVHLETGQVEVLYQSRRGACCGVATYHPLKYEVVFITGPEEPTDEWQYGPCHRQGMIVELGGNHSQRILDARDMTPPYTPGALRGGSHVHIYSPDGEWLSFTYEDAVLDQLAESGLRDRNLRTIAVAAPQSVIVPKTHPRNHDGSHFCAVVARVVNAPRPGSDEICRAYEECWIGANGYRRVDGGWRARAIAFLGDVVLSGGARATEVFVVDIPGDITQPGDGPLQGTSVRRPAPPHGCQQRRVTFTEHRKHPGVQGPRHWVQSSPDGSRLAFLMRDEEGVCQMFTVATAGGPVEQLSRLAAGVQSSFTWSRSGKWLAHLSRGAVCITSAATGKTYRVTKTCPTDGAPRPEACVISPDEKHLAYVRPVKTASGTFNQIFTVALGAKAME